MKQNFDLRRVLSILNISSEELADSLNMRYCDMAAILRGDSSVTDSLIGQLYRLYGKSIFF